MNYVFYMKQTFKWIILVPIALVLDGLAAIFTTIGRGLRWIQDQYDDSFQKLVYWCDKR